MKVLFVTLRALEINSSVTISNMGLIKGLVDLGYDVDLLMPQVSSELKQYEKVVSLYDKVNVIRIPSNTAYEKLVIGETNTVKKIITKILRKVFYKFSIYDNTIGLLKNADISIFNGKIYDLIISTSDPKTSHKFVSVLKKQGLQFKYWIQHWGDPMTLDITKENLYPKWFIKRIEEQIIEESNLCIYVSPLTEKEQIKVLPKQGHKIKFVPLPYYKEKIYAVNSSEKKSVTIGYFGDYNTKIRSIIPLYNLCKENTKYKLIVAGSTDLKLNETENIEIYPRLKQEEISELEEKCDVLVCICNKSGTQIPGKIYYYSSTNKPILVVVDGDYNFEIKSYLSKYNRFELCDNVEQSILSAINKIILNSNELKPSTEFSPKSIAKQLVQLLERLE